MCFLLVIETERFKLSLSVTDRAYKYNIVHTQGVNALRRVQV